MRNIFTIASVSLRRVYRDRVALFFMLMFPIIITFLIGVSIFNRIETLDVGVVAPKTPLASELVETIDASETLVVIGYDDTSELRDAIVRGEAAAGVVVPRSFDSDTVAGRRSQLTFVVNPRRGLAGGIRTAVDAAVARQSSVLQAAAFSSAKSGQSFGSALDRARRLESEQARVTLRHSQAETDRAELPGGFSYTAPANLVLSSFLTALAGAATLIESKRLGIARRVLAGPTTAGQILAGETLGRFLISLVQVSIIYGVGVVAFGVDWGDPLSAVMLLIVIAAAAASIGMLLGSVFRTPEQAASLGPPLGIGMGMLSGCMWPLEVVGDTMRQVGHVFPQAWAMDAWIETIARGAGVAEIAPQLGVLALFTLVLLPVAAWRLRRALVY